ncbi:aminodeoxychorismate/anthranilate synthase component II [Microbacterium betulae]|uniref:Aminodeoxychorismate/anthranilate synthase component II n=1 Tax=Microbacterium betulae TaxID=2981139 RepID=A0AA97I5R5_9MICO|nr:aminodeoxychorismate/anthranilate synthase component II [Microbacterium sp. AB]WOF21795.1 aminodeoxychorismate/anthranilate synthase component II [Microbacterium sp. AB]
MTKGHARRRRVLLVDNYDSYTGNLLQLIWGATGDAPDLVENDRVDLDALGDYTHIVLSPGPGTPYRAADVGLGIEVLRRTTAPVLGVCFGFQTMAVALGGRIVSAPHPAHGRVDEVSHGPSGLFDGVPERFDAVRYHSLVLGEPVPEGLRVTARSGDGLVMAGEIPERGWYGVQFHPESVATEHGARLVENFLATTDGDGRRRP